MFEFLICLGRADSEVKEQLDDLLEQVDRSNVDGWKASLEAPKKDDNGVPIRQGKKHGYSRWERGYLGIPKTSMEFSYPCWMES